MCTCCVRAIGTARALCRGELPGPCHRLVDHGCAHGAKQPVARGTSPSAASELGCSLVNGQLVPVPPPLAPGRRYTTMHAAIRLLIHTDTAAIHTDTHTIHVNTKTIHAHAHVTCTCTCACTCGRLGRAVGKGQVGGAGCGKVRDPYTLLLWLRYHKAVGGRWDGAAARSTHGNMVS